MPAALLSPRKAVKLFDTAVPGASTVISDEVAVPKGTVSLSLLSALVYGSAGTTIKSYLQTSFDNGVTWCDIVCHAYATASAAKVSSVKVATAVATVYTPTDGTLADNTIKDGLLGDRVRLKTAFAGTYLTSTYAASLTFND